MVELRGFLGTNAGAAICGAAVAVFPTGTNATPCTSTSGVTTTTTNSTGEWSASCLAANTYDVRITCGSSVRWRHYCDEIQVSLLQLGDAGTVFFGAASDAGKGGLPGMRIIMPSFSLLGSRTKYYTLLRLLI